MIERFGGWNGSGGCGAPILAVSVCFSGKNWKRRSDSSKTSKGPDVFLRTACGILWMPEEKVSVVSHSQGFRSGAARQSSGAEFAQRKRLIPGLRKSVSLVAPQVVE